MAPFDAVLGVEPLHVWDLFVAAPGTQTTNVVKINPNTLKVQELIRQPNSEAFGAGTVAVEVGKELWVGSFRGDRIARFPVPQPK